VPWAHRFRQNPPKKSRKARYFRLQTPITRLAGAESHARGSDPLIEKWLTNVCIAQIFRAAQGPNDWDTCPFCPIAVTEVAAASLRNPR